jgi:hypothetical protein
MMTKIKDFFAAYERGVNNFDPDLISSQFMEVFMGADPNGVFCHRNDQSLRDAVTQRRAVYMQMGFKSGELLGISSTELDARYTLAKVHWRMVFEKERGRTQAFRFFITYILFDGPEGLRIVLFIAHDDEEKVLREAGLLPLPTEPVQARQAILH